MRSGKTHDMLTKMLFPRMDLRTIRNVNHAMDNPSKMMMQFNRTFQTGKRYPVKGLNTWGHREFNHDWLSMMVTGYVTGGRDGLLASYVHIMADLARDRGAKKIGYPAMNFAEAAFEYNNYLMNKHKKKQRRYY